MTSANLQLLMAELKSISPMPDDDTLMHWPDEKVNPLETFGNVMTALEEEIKGTYPIELLQLLLEVFGVDDAFGITWQVLHMVEAYPNMQEAYSLVQKAISSPNAGTRRWCCFLLGRRRNKKDEPFLVARLQDKVAVVRQEALTGIIMLSQRYSMIHLLRLVEPLLQDEDYSVIDTAVDAINYLKESAQNEMDGDE